MIIKKLNAYMFLNTGRLRIPLQKLYEGGLSDPRNPNLQKMFQMLGLGEKAGSGFGKILRAWKEQQWLIPLVSEELDIEVTSVMLPMISLIPEKVEAELKEIVGNAYGQLTELDRIILVLAHQFKEINNIDIQQYRKEHPRDISDCLKKLVRKGYLTQSGRCRGTRYSLSNNNHSEQLSLPKNSEHKETSSEHYDLSSEHYQQLQEMAKSVKEKGRAKKGIVRNVILKLCSEHYLSLRTLAELLGREPDSIRNHYINPMIKEGLLELKYPEINHPQQAYKTTF
ncbi:ATP-binding protein [Crocosphaera sp. Alani8]|uniref:ATP-binding protein n=1 Tax=Crocosphaera sp. Alani8 TaxID=3038952 RepID=UPI00313F198C